MEKLITLSEDSPTKHSIIPENDGTIPFITYEVLITNPYRYTEKDFFKEVHHVRRNKKHLKIDSYSLKRRLLLKKYGWGAHINENLKIAIPCESIRYKELLDSKIVKKSKAYRNNQTMSQAL